MILKTTKSSFSCPKPDPQGTFHQQNVAAREGRRECSFNNWKASSRPAHQTQVVDSRFIDGKHLEQAFWQRIPLAGRTITSTDVIRAYRQDKTSLRAGLFLEMLLLNHIDHEGRQISPDEVIEELDRLPGLNNKCQVAKARVKEECCLRGLLLTPAGKRKPEPVKPDTVAKAFRIARAPLELGHFTATCCLRGLPLKQDGKQTPERVTPGEVVRTFPKSPEGKLGAAHFLEKCCLRGLPLHKGDEQAPEPVTTDMVVKAFSETPQGKLGLAHFKAECCLKGLQLTPAGKQVAEWITPEAVVKSFPAGPQGKLGIARFYAACCLKGQPIKCHGRQGLEPVTPEAVVKAFPANPHGKLGIARFMEQCCLKGLPLGGQQIIPDSVVKAFPDSPAGRLGIARFKEQCCLRGMLLTPDGKQVPEPITADTVVKNYEQGGWLLEKAICYCHLAFNGKKLKGNYLNNHQVLEAFSLLREDQSFRQVDYLLKQLHTLAGYNETDEALNTFQQARHILATAPIKDDDACQQRCILHFLALQYDLPVDQQLSAEQILQTINSLSHSFKKTRLHFFFMAHCYKTNRPLNGQIIGIHHVRACLQDLPAKGKMRHALDCWLDELGTPSETDLFNRLLFNKRERPVVVQGDGDNFADKSPFAGEGREQQVKSVVTNPSGGETECRSLWPIAGDRKAEAQRSGHVSDDVPGPNINNPEALQPLPNISASTAVDEQCPLLSPLMQQTLTIIQEINDTYARPAILMTGSCSRYLQGLCSSFNDIDLICTTEETAQTLMTRLASHNTLGDSEIQKKFSIKPVPGCSQLRLPQTYNINLIEGDLGIKTMGLQAIIDSRVMLEHKDVAPIHLPGVARPLICLPFHAEAQLMMDTLNHLAEHLDTLTGLLQKKPGFCIPRTILFNTAKSAEERIYGLFMRCLLTLNKARQFQALLAEEEAGYQSGPYSTAPHRLQELTEKLRGKLKSHTYHDAFIRRLEGWMALPQPSSGYQKKKYAFIKSLLEILTIAPGP